jgi:tyrocidine synthetase-3
LERLLAETNDIDSELERLTQSFDLRNGILFRAWLIELVDKRVFFHIDLPHIISDGESLQVILQSIENLYNNNVKKADPTQFSSFQRQEYSYLRGARYKIDEQFWKQRMEETFPKTLSTRIRQPVKNRQSLGADMDSFIRKRRLTRFQLLIMAYLLFLHQSFKVKHLTLMTPVNRRNEISLGSVIGLLSNVVIISSDIANNKTVWDFIEDIKQQVIAVLQHQNFPFEHLLKLSRAVNQSPSGIMQFFFGYHQVKGEYCLGDSLFQFYVPLRNRENIPLSIALFETEDKTYMRMTSAKGCYERKELQCFMASYQIIIAKLLESNGETLLSDIQGSIFRS